MKSSAQLAALAVLLLTMFVSGCGDNSKEARQADGLPAGVQPSDANKLPQDLQKLEISVSGGKFGHDRYDMQQGAVQLVISTTGGPYTFMGDKLIAARELPADAKTTIGVNVPTTGEYTMRLTGGTEGTAILNVRAPGGN
ncbi:MAG: hypothetical protein M3014_00165 [Chloroflexota bacterium]|nr:hypothetical protein [Chloroflexota bacterium]